MQQQWHLYCFTILGSFSTVIHSVTLHLLRNRPTSGSCDLSRHLARKITNGIHSCKPASLNYPINLAINANSATLLLPLPPPPLTDKNVNRDIKPYMRARTLHACPVFYFRAASFFSFVSVAVPVGTHFLYETRITLPGVS